MTPQRTIPFRLRTAATLAVAAAVCLCAPALASASVLPLPSIPVHGFVSAGSNASCGVSALGEGVCWGNSAAGRLDVPAGKTWALIETGNAHSCGVTTTGEGLCWGSNYNGQTNVPSGRTWASMSAGGDSSSCGVTTSGEGLCWGNDGSLAGIPGSPGPPDHPEWGTPGIAGTPADGRLDVPTGKTWASISAGNKHTCGVTTTGEGLCWGKSNGGRTDVPTGRTWASISAGSSHTCGLTTTGEGLCWGDNSSGQTDVPSEKTWASITAGTAYQSCGVTTTGEGLCWGDDSNGEISLPTGKTWSSITAGYTHSCGVTTTNKAYCWGDNSQGATAIPFRTFLMPGATQPSVPSNFTGVPSDSSVLSGVIGFTLDESGGSVECRLVTNSVAGGWRRCTSVLGHSGTYSFNRLTGGSTYQLDVRQINSYGNVSPIGSSTTWTPDPPSTPSAPTNPLPSIPVHGFVSAGSNASCGVSALGEGVCWGNSAAGRLDVPAGKTWALIETGNAHSCGVTTTGEGLCWGSNYNGQTNVPSGRTWASMSAGGDSSSCGVTTSGEGLCWGNDGSLAGIPGSPGPPDHPEWGTPGIAGTPADGRLDVPTGKTWASISAGNKHTCGVTTTGEGLCWGKSNGGRTDVPTGRTWASISAGSSHTCGLTTTGEGLCWGDNSSGQTDVPSEKTWASITAGTAYQSCGVTTTGEGLCWGDDSNGEISLPTGKTWSSITAGYTHSCGVTTTNKAYCWGDNSQGATAIPDGPFVADIALTETPNSRSNMTSGTAQFTLATSGGTVQCRLVTNSIPGSWTACTTVSGTSGTYAFSGLTTGSTYQVQVRQTNPSDGLMIDSGVTQTWTVDALGSTAPSLDSGSQTVDRSTTIKGSGQGLTGVSDGAASPTFQWNRCTTLNDASSCSAITREGGANGAWWGIRNADIGYQLQLKVTWDTVQGVINALSEVTGIVGPAAVATPVLETGANAWPVKKVGLRSSFGKWSGYVAGVTTATFEWLICADATDTTSCVVSPTSRNSQWYKPTAGDVGSYLRSRATLTTRGVSAVAYSDSGLVHATATVGRRARSAVRQRVHAPKRQTKHTTKHRTQS